MTSRNSCDEREIDRLIDRMCDQIVTADDLAELGRLVVEYPAVQDRYLAALEIHAGLAWRMSPGRQFSPEELLRYGSGDSGFGVRDSGREENALPNFALELSPFPTLSTTHHPLPTNFVGGPVFSYMVATVVLCVMLLGFWAYKITHVAEVAEGKGKPSIDSPADPRFEFVGHVTGMMDCVWNEGSAGTMVGASVPLGREYSLTSGLIELTYVSGAKVILEGPCTYRADSDAGGYLAIGKLTARVEKKAASAKPRAANHNSSSLIPHPSSLFFITTPTAVVTDLGTEFGVIVDKNGNTDTHVLEGIVKVNISGNTHESIRLAVGESVRVEKTNEGNKHVVTRGKADVTAFPIHPGELAAMLEKERLGRFRRWQDFGKKLLNRKDLVAYYDFQPVKNNRLLLRDRTSKFGPDSQDTNIEGAYWVPGRFPGKYALRFTSSYHAAQIRVDGLAGSRQLTLAAWVLVDQMSQNVIYLLTTEVQSSRDASGDNVAVGSVNWGLKPNGMMGLAGKSDKRRGTLVLYSPVRAIGKNQLHRWCFLAVTCDIDAGETVFYRNDQCLGIKMGHTLSDTETFSGLPCDIVRPGASRPLDISESRRFFQGSIGEIMVFRKALSPEEIRDIYQRPTHPLRTVNRRT